MTGWGRGLLAGARELLGLLVDDGAVAIGVLVAVAVAALLAGALGDGVGWVLLGLVWVALAVSLVRAGRARSRASVPDPDQLRS